MAFSRRNARIDACQQRHKRRQWRVVRCSAACERTVPAVDPRLVPSIGSAHAARIAKSCLEHGEKAIGPRLQGGRRAHHFMAFAGPGGCARRTFRRPSGIDRDQLWTIRPVPPKDVAARSSNRVLRSGGILRHPDVVFSKALQEANSPIGRRRGSAAWAAPLHPSER
jgi:hypothetical protein